MKADEQLYQSPPLGKKFICYCSDKSTNVRQESLTLFIRRMGALGKNCTPRQMLPRSDQLPQKKGCCGPLEWASSLPQTCSGSDSKSSACQYWDLFWVRCSVRGLGYREKENSPGTVWKTHWDDPGWIPGAHQSCPSTEQGRERIMKHSWTGIRAGRAHSLLTAMGKTD